MLLAIAPAILKGRTMAKRKSSARPLSSPLTGGFKSYAELEKFSKPDAAKLTERQAAHDKSVDELAKLLAPAFRRTTTPDTTKRLKPKTKHGTTPYAPRDRAWQGTPESSWQNIFCRVKPDSRGNTRIEFYRHKGMKPMATYHPHSEKVRGSTEANAYWMFWGCADKRSESKISIASFMRESKCNDMRRAAGERIRRFNDHLTDLRLPKNAFRLMDDGTVRFACRIRVDSHDRPPVYEDDID